MSQLLAVRVHPDRDRGAGGERGGEQAGGGGAGVGAAGLGGSSTTSVWPSTSTSWWWPLRRRARCARDQPRLAAAALEQRGVVDVGEAGDRVDEVGGAVEVGEHRPRGELARLGERGDAALGAAQDRAGEVELGRRAWVPPGITNFGGSSTRSM